MMEIILETPIEELTPKLIAFNSAQIIAQLRPLLENYKNTTYTEKQIATAKADRASLNKFKDAIEDERKRIKKYYNQPYDKFEQEVKRIVALIDDASKCIDTQVKAFEDQKKTAKKAEIIEFWNNNIGNLADLIDINNVFSDQWLNSTYSMKKVQEDITTFIAKVNNDLEVITSLNFEQETHLKDFYLRTFDLTATLQEKARLEVQTAKIAEITPKTPLEHEKDGGGEEFIDPTSKNANNPLLTIDFRVYCTQEQKQLIRNFFINNNIKYGLVPKMED